MNIFIESDGQKDVFRKVSRGSASRLHDCVSSTKFQFECQQINILKIPCFKYH
jgi:hypothetical protein